LEKYKFSFIIKIMLLYSSSCSQLITFNNSQSIGFNIMPSIAANLQNSDRHFLISHIRFTLMLCIALFSVNAYADSTFLLQLGNSSSNEEATKKWDDIKSKNADVVGKFNLHIAEVALPPDNSINYRTQAGPISSHDKAAAACDTLKSRDVECYVVETALLTSDPVPVAASVPDAMPAPIVLEPVMQTTPSTVASADVPPSPPSIDIAPQPSQEASIVAPAPSILQPAPIGTIQENNTATAVQPTSTEPKKPGFFGRLFGKSSDKASTSKPPTSLNANDTVAAAPASILPTPAPAITPVAVVTATPVIESPAQPEKHIASPFVNPALLAAPVVPVSTSTTTPSDKTAHVQVAEAIRVPLSNKKSRTKFAVKNLPTVNGLGGLPSESTSKTYWTQLSYFHDETSARNFYQDLRTAYPQLGSGIRIRITHPYSFENGRVSLRMGPFAGTGDAYTICKAADKQNLRCIIVKDLGSSVAANTAREHHPSPINTAMPHHTEQQQGFTPPPTNYWLQLGTFTSEDDAWDSWNALKSNHSALLGRAHATVTMPSMSSSMRSVYRLRTGPYNNESSTDSLCNNLQSLGVDCIVISDK
jgi:hypothetical protein